MGDSKRRSKKNTESADHIHQQETSTIMQRQNVEDLIEIKTMVWMSDTILWYRDGDNYKITVV